MTIKGPAVTIGMPVFNGQRYIRQAIESALSQTFGDFELLISDNASTDGTMEICREYADRDRRIRLLQQESNLGPFRNLQFVTDHARGDLLAWLAHDDTLEPQFVEETVLYLQHNPRSVLACCDFRIIDDVGTQIDLEELRGIRQVIDWQRRCAEFYKYPISNAYFAIYGMMRSNICKAILSTMREPRQMAQMELPILARFAAAGEITSIPLVLRTYRRHEASLYHSEINTSKTYTKAKRNISRFTHAVGLILDQIYILGVSTVRDRAKVAVLVRVARHYYLRVISRHPVAPSNFK